MGRSRGDVRQNSEKPMEGSRFLHERTDGPIEFNSDVRHVETFRLPQRRSGGHQKTSLVFKFELDGHIPANHSTALRAGSEKSLRHALFPDAGEGGAYSHFGSGQVRVSLQRFLSGLRSKKANTDMMVEQTTVERANQLM